MNKSLKKNKGILFLCVLFIILFIWLIFLGLNYQRQVIIDSHKQNLRIMANEKASQVNTFLEMQKDKSVILGSMDVFREVAMFPNDAAKIKAAKKLIDSLKDTVSGIGILTNKGIVIVSADNPAGADYSSLPGFPVTNDNLNIRFTRYYDKQRKKDYYGVGGPIYDSNEKNNSIGVISFDVEFDKISELMKETVESDGSEVYLIDDTGMLLSGSKYIGNGNKHGVLIQEVESEGATLCLDDLKKYLKNGEFEEHEEKFIQYKNYMGDEVLGVHAYVQGIRGCVIAEEHTDEMIKLSFIDYIKNIFKKEAKDEK